MQATDGRLARASRAALSEGGDLATRIAAFAPRPAQQDLAAAIATTFEAGEVLVAEAGTGTGKTFAYLVPALLSGLKTIVSTGTRALQDQLYHRDLPRVRDALGTGLKTALLKGRANYLCHYRMRQAQGGALAPPAVRVGVAARAPYSEPRFTSREQVAQFQRIVAWSGRTKMGDLAELEALPEDSPLIPLVTSTADNCLGGECPFFADCFVVAARARAQAADLVVVNHHLLLADLALKQEGFGEILPGAQAFVVDEAHQLPDLAAQFFGESVSARPLVELARDAIAECKDVPAALAAVQQPARGVEHAVRALRAAMDVLPIRGTRSRALDAEGVEAAFDALETALHELRTVLEPYRQAAPGLDSAALRAADALVRASRWREQPDAMACDDDDGADADAELDATDALPRADAAGVHWYELTPRGFRLARTPLDVAGPLTRHREASRAAWVFTSATLAVDGHFDHYARKLGLVDPPTLLAPSPFDWQRQALRLLPRGLPDPSSRDYTACMVEAIRPVLEASSGRAFVLFASHRALREAAQLLRDGPWPLFVQGDAPRALLLERFRASGHGVLLGAASFREGVDVAGDALSVVVIDKLPFAAPDDPVFEARLEAIRRAGGNPFRDEQLPQAVIALKQGAGRLIRTESDRGVLVLCDPRLTQKSYGRVFLDSLPGMPITRDIADVQAFFSTSAVSAITATS